MKYIIMKDSSGLFQPVVFDNALVHADVALGLSNGSTYLASAGFCKRGEGGVWEVFGESVSLGLNPGPQDAPMISLFLENGMSGLDLKNYLTYLSIKDLEWNDVTS